MKIYEIIRSNGGWNNWSMFEIEKYPCIDNNEARMRERYWFEQLKSKLNTFRPLSTPEEKHLSNIKKCYDYRQLNRQALLDEKKEYWKKNREELVIKNNIYRKENRDTINKQKMEHYRKNKDEINRVRREKYKTKNGNNIAT